MIDNPSRHDEVDTHLRTWCCWKESSRLAGEADFLNKDSLLARQVFCFLPVSLFTVFPVLENAMNRLET